MSGTADTPPIPPPTAYPGGFDAIAASILLRRFFGVPFFRPPVSPAQLFNVWAYLLGPLAFLGAGLWRKGLVLSAIALFLYAPLLLPSDVSALVSALVEAYTPYHQLLEGVSLLFVLLFCTGRSTAALVIFLLFFAVFLYGALHTEPLYLGPKHGLAYIWLSTGLVWQTLFQTCLAALLGLRLTALTVLLFAGAGLLLLGFPLDLPLAALPAAAFPVFCGMMATYDRYRKDVLHETFWW